MNTLAGTGQLVRLALRRDRIMLPIWIVLFAVMANSSASATKALYSTHAALIQAAQAVNKAPSIVALYGPIYDESSLGAISLFKLGALGSALVAVLAIILMIRHTRSEEEAGRLELVGAGVVGRLAPLAASFIVTVGAMLLLGILTGLALVGAGLSASGSFAFGLSWAMAGIAFAAVAGVTAQFTSGARAANGIALAVLGVSYVLRAVADTAGEGGPTWLRWLSPIGWSQQVRAFQGDRWWVLTLPVVFALVMTVAAFVLVERRDHGAGLFPDRLGPAQAGATLGGSFGLAWRLQRGNLFGWLVAFLGLGFLFGSIATNVGSFLDSDAAREMIQKLGGVEAITDAFMSTELGMTGIIASAFAVQVALRLRTEEAALRTESILATGVTRTGWALSHILFSLMGTTVLLLAGGFAAGLSYSSQTGHTDDLWRVLVAALVRLPAAWVLTGIVVLAFGFAPRWATVGWVALVAFLVLGEFGPLFKLPQLVMDISPYAHSPHLPGNDLSALPLVSLAVVAAILIVAGLFGFRRRDVPVT